MTKRITVSKILSEKNLALRRKLWPTIEDHMLWNRKRNDGYTTIPRTMPYIFQIMDSLSSGKPVSQTYFVLWVYSFDESLIIINNPKIMAFESGFTGQRGETTWNGRMKILLDLGFIDAKGGASGQYNYVLIFNPYTVIKNLKNEERGNLIPENIYYSFIQRSNDIKAT